MPQGKYIDAKVLLVDALGNSLIDSNGELVVVGVDMVTVRANYTTAQANTAIASVAAGSRIAVTSFMVTADNANTVDVAVVIGFGAAATPTTTGVIGAHPGIAPGSGFGRGNGMGKLGVGTDGQDVFITSEVPTGGSIDVVLTYLVLTP